MKRFLLLLGVGMLGFLVVASLYLLVEPFLPMLPGLMASLLPILTSRWFIAGVIGAALAIIIFLAWAYSGEW